MIASWGCGGGCVSIAVIDAQDGGPAVTEDTRQRAELLMHELVRSLTHRSRTIVSWPQLSFHPVSRAGGDFAVLSRPCLIRQECLATQAMAGKFDGRGEFYD